MAEYVSVNFYSDSTEILSGFVLMQPACIGFWFDKEY